MSELTVKLTSLVFLVKVFRFQSDTIWHSLRESNISPHNRPKGNFQKKKFVNERKAPIFLKVPKSFFSKTIHAQMRIRFTSYLKISDLLITIIRRICGRREREKGLKGEHSNRARLVAKNERETKANKKIVYMIRVP